MKKLFALALVISVLPGTINTSQLDLTSLAELAAGGDLDAELALAEKRADDLRKKAQQKKATGEAITQQMSSLEAARAAEEEAKNHALNDLRKFQEQAKQHGESRLAELKPIKAAKEVHITEYTTQRATALAAYISEHNNATAAYTKARRTSAAQLTAQITEMEKFIAPLLAPIDAPANVPAVQTPAVPTAI